jgi:predicted AlkP superfamily phosphohydrolase/phosphomutase
MTAKSIWIELDSVHSDVLARAMEAGRMPNLAGLAAGAAVKKIRYEIPLQVAAWGTAHTGLSVAQHGAFAFDMPRRGSYRMAIETNPIDPGHSCWDILSRAGKRVLVINSVNPIPAPDINGIQLNNWLVHVNGRSFEGATSFPPGVAEKLNEEFPEDDFSTRDFAGSASADPRRLTHSVLNNLARKQEIYCRLIDREDWDHVHAGFDDIHGIGHVLLHLLEAPGEAGGSIADEILGRLDSTIGAIVEHAGANAEIMVVALGGIGPANTWSHMVDKIIGRLENGEDNNTGAYGTLGRFWIRQPMWLKDRILPLKSYLREIYLARKRRSARAFAMPLNEESGGVRVNLRGREPHGTVSPGPEFRQLLDDLRDAFVELRDIETGEPLVSDVTFAADTVAGLDADHMLPDMFIGWNRNIQMHTVCSERLGRIEMDFHPDRSGDHLVDGVLVLSDSASRGLAGQDTVSVFDLAPTVAAIHGVPMPAGRPGRPLAACAGPSRSGRAAAAGR